MTLARHRWLLARRAAQLGFLSLFLSGPLTGVWIAKGTLAASLTLGVLPLTDPLMALQALLAGHVFATIGWVGALIVAAAYAAVGGRSYCAWLCPINPVTDFAAWLRGRLRLTGGLAIDRRLRQAVLLGVLVVAGATGTIAWENLNPVTILHRGLIFAGLTGAGTAVSVTLAVFLFDLGVAPRGWCGGLCPVGAFYGWLGARGVVRVAAVNRDACDDCMKCFGVCPERHVIAPALRGKAKGIGPVILSADCTNCGRCIDICPHAVFRFGPRWRTGLDDVC